MLVTGYGTLNGKDYWLVKNRYNITLTNSIYILYLTLKINTHTSKHTHTPYIHIILCTPSCIRIHTRTLAFQLG